MNCKLKEEHREKMLPRQWSKQCNLAVKSALPGAAGDLQRFLPLKMLVGF